MGEKVWTVIRRIDAKGVSAETHKVIIGPQLFENIEKPVNRETFRELCADVRS